MYGPPAVWTKLPQDPSGASRSEGSAQITRGEHSPQCAGACVGTGPGARPCRPCRGDRGAQTPMRALSDAGAGISDHTGDHAEGVGAQSADHAQGGAYTRRVLSHEALPILACSKRPSGTGGGSYEERFATRYASAEEMVAALRIL